MSFSTFKLLVPLVVLVFLLFAVFKPSPEAPSSSKPNASVEPNLDPSRFLVRPFYSENGEIALALDGGALPIAGGQVPSIIIGKNVLRMVHLAWLHDWTSAECRASFKNLQVLYASNEGASLPALRIYLNPIFSDAAGEILHRAMLQVFFRSANRDFYFTLANEMSTGALAASPGAIRSRIELIAPILLDDWDSKLDWLESDIEKTFSISREQQARNSVIAPNKHTDQLTSMVASLPPFSSQQELITFLQNANTIQRAWLQTLPKPNSVTRPAR